MQLPQRCSGLDILPILYAPEQIVLHVLKLHNIRYSCRWLFHVHFKRDKITAQCTHRKTGAKQVRSAWKGLLVSYDRRFHSCTRVACASVLVLKVGWLVNYNRKFHNPRASFLLQKTLAQPTTTASLTSLLVPSLQCPSWKQSAVNVYNSSQQFCSLCLKSLYTSLLPAPFKPARLNAFV